MFEPGDEVAINRMYKSISGIDRSPEMYSWEWLDTWRGRATMYLLFDADQPAGDQLVGQYSLIPTPFSIFGENYLAAKTENCMSHPQYRSRRIYFPHEKESFEKAKEHYQLFFTTTGKVAKGAPGAIRLKLGYTAFDDWVTYHYYTDLGALARIKVEEIGKKLGSLTFPAKVLGRMLALLYFYVFQGRVQRNSRLDSDVKVAQSSGSLLGEIERLWEKNRELFGITTRRTREYIQWRIDKNPYWQHRYLIHVQDKQLRGYAIFHADRRNFLRIVDILADQRDEHIYHRLLENMKALALKEARSGVVFSTLQKNSFFKKVFTANHFMLPASSSLKRKGALTDFYVYLSDTIKSDRNLLQPDNWYITELVKEGR